MGCDGVFDELKNDDVVNAAWNEIEKHVGKVSYNELAKRAAENIIKTCFDKRSTDNITVIVILLRDEQYYAKGRTIYEIVF